MENPIAVMISVVSMKVRRKDVVEYYGDGGWDIHMNVCVVSQADVLIYLL